MIAYNLYSVPNANIPVNSIMKKARRVQHLGAILNFNCPFARDIIELVKREILRKNKCITLLYE